MKTASVKQLCLSAMFVALTIVCAQIAIPLPFTDVPLSLATLAVLLSGSLLGSLRGAAVQGIYILMGLAGLPVFANFTGGISRVMGPTGGYIWGYAAAAVFTGLLLSRLGHKLWAYPTAMVIGTIGCYALGTVWYMLYAGVGLVPALLLCVVPFLPGDAIKIAAASLLSYRLKPVLNRMTALA